MVRRRKYPSLTGRSHYRRDKRRRAKRTGIRRSKSGRKYYERRRNRADKNPRRGL